nr:reverse transcriptase domain-containing protein [Tanacetum cinerariifolium]
MMCTKMVPDEDEDRVENIIGGLPDNIQGNMIAAEPMRLQDAVWIASNLMDQKLKGYALKNAENKRGLEVNQRDNRGQQPPFKRQNVGGQNMARAYTAGNNERKPYNGPLPLYNKCKLHHEGPCTVRCGKCNKVGHLTRDCKYTLAINFTSSLHDMENAASVPTILLSPIDTMVDQRTMAELLRAPTEGYAEEAWDRYKDLLRACPHHGFTELHQLETFYNALNPADQDSLNSATGGNLLERRTKDVLTIIENKSKCLATGGNTLPELRDNFKDTLQQPQLTTIREKLLVLANTPLNENCSAVILKKLPKKLGDLGKFLIPCGFNELKRKALADLGASINLMPLTVWKKLGLPELISTRMTLELANRAICTPVGISRDVFILVGKFTFPANFVIVDYESDPRVPLILGIPFLWSARSLIDVHGEEMILRDEGGNVLPKKLLDLDSTKYLHPSHNVNPLSGSTTSSSSPNQLLEEFADELALITFPPGNDDLQFYIEMFTDEHALDYSSPPLYDEYDDDLFEVEFDTEYYDSFLSEDFSKVDALPSTNNEDKVFNIGILIRENLFEIITRVAQDKNEKKLAISHVSLILKDFDPPLYEISSFKEVLGAETLLLISSKNEEKVFKPEIHTFKEVHSFFIPELSHHGYKVFKIIKILKSPMRIFLFSSREDIHILDVPCLYFYPP